MVQSRNTTVDYTVKGISYMGLSAYGKIMVGDRAFEFYNDRNVKDYIQIPWDEVDTIVASVLFKGRKISRFAIMTKSSTASCLEIFPSMPESRCITKSGACTVR